MNLLLITSLFSYFILYNCLEQNIEFVYESLPYKIFEVGSHNGSSKNIKIASEANVAAVAIGKAGIMIIDKDFNSIIFPPRLSENDQLEEQYIESLQITKDGKFIFSAMKGLIAVFQLIDNKQIQLISTIDITGINVADLLLDNEEQVLFLFAQTRVIRWYDIRNKSKILLAGEFLNEAMLFWKGQISPDGSLLYLSGDQDGLLLFFIEKKFNGSGVDEKMEVALTKILRKQAISSFLELVILNEYVFAIDKWSGIQILYSFLEIKTPLKNPGDPDIENYNNNIIQMHKADLPGCSGFTSTITLSSNSKYLYVGVRSQGILIYEMTSPIKPRFFQQLQLTGQSVSVRLSPKIKEGEDNPFDNQYIFYTNFASVVVYQKQIPTLFNNIPNLFNSHQSKILTEEVIGTAATKWRCHISSNNKYFFGAFDSDSLIVYKLNIPSTSNPQPMSMKLLFQFNEVDEIMNSVDSLRQFPPDESIPYGFFVDSFQFSKDEKYMYFCSASYDYSVIAYKFEIIKEIINNEEAWSFKFIKRLKHTQVYYSEQMDLSDDELHAIMAFDVGIVLVDLVAFEVISQFNNEGILGTCVGAVLSHDKKHALSVVRNVGLFIYDTSDMKQPTLAKTWRTNGGETLLRSKTEKIIYFIDGFNGILLLDSTQFPEIVVISQFQTAGWTNFISFTKMEKYGIISTMDTGTLALIDLQDKTNPRLIMKSTVEGYDSQSTCLDYSTMSFGFSPNKSAVIFFSMQSQVSIHVEREIKQTKTQQQRKLSNDEAFEVGSSYLVRFVTLFREQNQIVQHIYYYKNLIFQELPSWMEIDRENQSDGNLQSVISINVPKECLESEQSKSSFLTIIIQSCLQLSSSSFIYNTDILTTSAQESDQVYKYLRYNGYINGQNCVTDFFDDTTQLVEIEDAFKDNPIDQNKLKNFKEYANKTLKLSIVRNHFIFDVISSLKFNQENKNQMIAANQDYISIHLSFPVNYSPFIFVQKVYPDIIIYLNDDKTVMKIEGSKQDVNKALSNQILYFDLTKKEDSSDKNLSGEKVLNIQIMDNFNYDLQYVLKVPEQVKFLREKKDIQVALSLQDQVNKQYEDANLYIDVAFLIEFNKKSFIDPDDIDLTYELQQKINGLFVAITSDSLIKFDNNNLRLVGTPASTDLFTTVSIRLVASNGYTSQYQEFVIKINKMPLSYIFNMLLKILGPIAFLIGLYKKRSIFMNLFFKKNTMYSTEIAQVNQMYRKKITILGYDYEIAYLFFLRFLKVKSKDIRKVSATFYDILNQQYKNKQLDSSFQSQTQINTIKNNQQSTKNNTNRNDHFGFSNINSEVNLANIKKTGGDLICLNSEIILNDCEKQSSSQQQETYNTKLQLVTDRIESQRNKFSPRLQQQDVYDNMTKNMQIQSLQPKYESDIKYFQKKQQSNSNLNVDSFINNKQKQVEKQTQSKKKLQKEFPIKQQKNSYLYIKCLTTQNNNEFSLDNLFKAILESNINVTYNLQNYQISKYKEDIQNPHSRFYNCLKAVIARFLLDNDEKGLHLYQFLKKYSMEKSENQQNDWFKLYVDIKATAEVDKYGIPIPFSNTFLKEDIFYDILQILQQIPLNLQRANFCFDSSLIDQSINPKIIQEVLFADALGLQRVSAKSILKCHGQSLHVENHSIASIEAFQLEEEGCCLCLKRPFSWNYKQLPISKYLSLPSWLGYDCKNGVIILEGIPSNQDVNHVLIRIYDQIRFITYQFHLKIEENPNQNDSIQKYYKGDTKQEQQYETSSNNINSPSNQGKIIQQSLSLQNRQRQGSLTNNSIFKITQTIKNKLKMEQKITEDESCDKSSNKNKDEENRHEQSEQIEERSVETINERGQDFNTPPIFTHSYMEGLKLQAKSTSKEFLFNIQLPKN